MDKFLIIAGTEKAGTTSLYQYLSDSGLFTVSLKKETNYLRNSQSLVNYQSYIENFEVPSGNKYYLESSPGYLADSGVVVRNIKKLSLQNSNYIFLLRSPLSRLKSSFLFHKSRLYIPKDLSFNEYIEKCMKFETGVAPVDLGLDEWFLRVPDAGLYYKHLIDFINADIENLTVIPFDFLSSEPKKCVNFILDNIEIKSDFFNNYDFNTSNVTNGFRFTILQSLALFLNKNLESIFYKYPSFKRFFLAIYKSINGAPKENIHLSQDLKKLLKSYYYDDLVSLERDQLVPKDIIRAWLNEFDDD